MNRSKRWWLWLLPIAVGGMFWTFQRASASGPFCGHGHPAATSAADVEAHLDGKLEHVLDSVDASEAQREQAQAIAHALSPQLFQLMQEGRDLRSELKDALLAEQLDTTRIEGLRGKLAVLSQKLVETGLDGVTQLSSVLTPEQRAKVSDRLAHMHP